MYAPLASGMKEPTSRLEILIFYAPITHTYVCTWHGIINTTNTDVDNYDSSFRRQMDLPPMDITKSAGLVPGVNLKSNRDSVKYGTTWEVCPKKITLPLAKSNNLSNREKVWTDGW
jgi:hypothetical protein